MRALTKEERVQSRYIPAGMTEYRRDGDSVIYANLDRLSAIAYRGTSRKAEWYYRFTTSDQFNVRVSRFFESIAMCKNEKQKRMDAKKNYQTISKPGTIFCHSWGWEQTNIDYYQVVEVLGRTTVIIQQITTKILPHEKEGYSSMSGMAVPVPDAFTKDSKPMKKRVSKSGTEGQEYISMNSYSSAMTWNGKPEYCSWYG